MTRFNFGSIVVVEDNLIGVVVKSWASDRTGLISYDIYVRSFNKIKEYPADEVKMYIYDKELTDEDMEYQEP